MAKDKLKTLGNIASRLIPALAPAAGAAALPYNPRLGAAIGSGIAGAFPTRRENQQAEAFEMQKLESKQRMELGLIASGNDAERLSIAKADRADRKASRAEASELNKMTKESVLDERSIRASEGLYENISALGKGLVDGELSRTFQGFNKGTPPTESEMKSLGRLDSVADHTRGMISISGMKYIEDNPDIMNDPAGYRALQGSFVQSGLELSKDENGKAVLTDPFKLGSGPDGVWTQEDIVESSKVMRARAMREAAHMQVIKSATKTPSQRQFNKYSTQSLENGAEPTEAVEHFEKFATEYGKEFVSIKATLEEGGARLASGDIDGAMAVIGNSLEELGTLHQPEYLPSLSLDQGMSLGRQGL